jgi:hypothetical protein
MEWIYAYHFNERSQLVVAVLEPQGIKEWVGGWYDIQKSIEPSSFNMLR